jgi:hypothetical protein
MVITALHGDENEFWLPRVPSPLVVSIVGRQLLPKPLDGSANRVK